MSRRSLLALILTTACLAAPVAAQAAPYEHHVNATATGSGGAASTVDSVATDAAIKTLAQGGNAVDAAVAAAGVLGVVEPYSCGIGGGGFMLIRTPGGKVTTIDGRETAPDAMTPTSFWRGGKALAFDPARWSGLSAGVPGTPATWEKALKEYGTWSLKRALAPGIDVAREGFVIDKTFYDQTNGDVPYFDDITETAALYLTPTGQARAIGSVQRNPDMAKAYERIGRLGARQGFYRGPIANAMVEAARHPNLRPGVEASHPWYPGLITKADVKDYRAPEREPTVSGYENTRVYGMGPPSSGGTTVAEALNILEQKPEYAAGDAVDKYHYYLESTRYTYADRNAWLADPAFFDVPLAGLLSDDFAEERADLITDQAAQSPVAAGDPTDDGAEGANAATVWHPSDHTTHLTVVDKDGMTVSYTFTIESIGGNGIVVPGWGFLLNNELTDFNYDSTTHPNRSDGGKRPRSSMAPTFVERDGKPFLALGSPGGATIPTTVLQVLLHRLDFGYDLPGAIAAPRASQRNATMTPAEPAFIIDYGAQLQAEHGQAFSSIAELGSLEAVEFLPGGGLRAGAEPVRRGGGNAQVVSP
jgi:gamma-glutamyltranspeptidase/glutathione hydrolase